MSRDSAAHDLDLQTQDLVGQEDKKDRQIISGTREVKAVLKSNVGVLEINRMTRIKQGKWKKGRESQARPSQAGRIHGSF